MEYMNYIARYFKPLQNSLRVSKDQFYIDQSNEDIFNKDVSSENIFENILGNDINKLITYLSSN